MGTSRIARFSVAARIVLAALLVCTLMSITPASAGGAADGAFADTAPTSNTQSTGSEQRVIRVGYMDIPGMLSRNADGTFEGYTYDYLQRIAQFTG